MSLEGRVGEDFETLAEDCKMSVGIGAMKEDSRQCV